MRGERWLSLSALLRYAQNGATKLVGAKRLSRLRLSHDYVVQSSLRDLVKGSGEKSIFSDFFIFMTESRSDD